MRSGDDAMTSDVDWCEMMAVDGVSIRQTQSHISMRNTRQSARTRHFCTFCGCLSISFKYLFLHLISHPFLIVQ